VCGIDDRAAVVLSGESSPGLENPTGIQSFGGADGAATVEACRAAVPFPAIQVQKDDFMAKAGVTCDGPGATAFRVARVAAGDDYLESARGGLSPEGQSGSGGK
jgi:hypothetical protein